MAKGNNQKLKLLYLMELFYERTDLNHGVSVQEMISYLNQREVDADRRTIYTDLEDLRTFGLDIESYHVGRNVYYHLLSRNFELAELKLLVDSVQASKFITEKKSRELIKKLEQLVSNEEAKELHRQVILSGRVKTVNESIYYNVDAIHQAINNNHPLAFHYMQWNLKKELEPRKNGVLYYVSPWALLWDNESYYLIGYDEESQQLRHYRVDKMRNISIREKESRAGKEVFEGEDLPKYARSLFGMFGGDEKKVTLLCHNNMIGSILDRFGTDIPIIPVDDSHFRTTVNVTVSQYFLGWIIGLGDGVTIIGPEEVTALVQQQICRLQKQYQIE